jgi:hypothetical protein
MKMVKDNWANVNSSSNNENTINTGFESSIQINANNINEQLTTTAPTTITQKHHDANNCAVNQVNSNSTWGYFESRENFINLHFC